MSLEPNEVTDVLLRLAESEALQSFLIKHFARKVIEHEIMRRGLIEPLLDLPALAAILGLTVKGLQKQMQEKTLDIPFIKKGGYKFIPDDVRAWMRRNRVQPNVRPDSLKKVKRKRPRLKAAAF